jgi:hypothetical protein
MLTKPASYRTVTTDHLPYLGLDIAYALKIWPSLSKSEMYPKQLRVLCNDSAYYVSASLQTPHR